MEKLKINELAHNLRKQLEEVLPDDKKYLAVEVTNISIDYLKIIKRLERKE